MAEKASAEFNLPHDGAVEAVGGCAQVSDEQATVQAQHAFRPQRRLDSQRAVSNGSRLDNVHLATWCGCIVISVTLLVMHSRIRLLGVRHAAIEYVSLTLGMRRSRWQRNYVPVVGQHEAL